jgi:hypothetical protein
MTAHFSETIHGWLGWCPNTPALRTAPLVRTVPHETMHADRPGGSGPAGRSGRVRLGISIATGSLKTMVRNRYLLGFSFFSGLVMFILLVAKVWDVQHWENTLPFDITLTFGNSPMVFDPWLFLAEAICLTCFTLVLAGLVLHRNRGMTPVTIRGGFAGVGTHTVPLSILSIALALIATMVFAIVSQTGFFMDLVMYIQMAVIWIPNAYIPYGDVTVFFYSFILLFINIFLFLVALFLVPVIVLKTEGLVPALRGLITLITRTRSEILGSILVYGAIVLMVAFAALVIGHLPQMLFDGYSFHATVRTHPLMMVVDYGFILGCMILMAAGCTAAGVATADMFTIKKIDGMNGIPEDTGKTPEPAS